MIDFARLRRDLAEERYFAGLPAMIMEAWEIEDASEDELLNMAEAEGIDLSEYEL